MINHRPHLTTLAHTNSVGHQRIHTLFVKKGKGIHKPKAQMGGTYPGFISMKHT